MKDRSLRQALARLAPAGRRHLSRLDLEAEPAALYASLRGKGAGVLLESARRQGPSGRYSLVLPRPFARLEAKRGLVGLSARGARPLSVRTDPIAALRAALRAGSAPASGGQEPFLGGAAGYLGYEARAYLERRCTQRASDDLRLPDLYFLFFEEGILIDHELGVTTVFCHGPKAGASRRLAVLERACRESLRSAARPHAAAASPPSLVQRSFTREGFLEAVRAAKRHIRRGDIFQANLSQRLSFSFRGDAWSVYERLRRINPSPFFGYLEGGGFRLVCGSPERLVKLRDGWLQTRPIAGTRRRGASDRDDRTLSRELLLSPKERAEHVMLVDLERNDLGRVCRYGSVRVNELMAVEQYSHVKHIVSNVVGQLDGGRDRVDALAALFPGGTITGTPKVRCMEIIDSLEPVARGPYTGSLGYLSWSGEMDLNIVIRSWVMSAGRAHLQVGAGIVADSSPEREYLETLEKAAAPLAALLGERASAKLLRRLRREGVR